MDSVITTLKKFVSGDSAKPKQSAPAFYLQSTITNGMLPFTNASVEVLAFFDKEHYQKIANVEYSWYRIFQGNDSSIIALICLFIKKTFIFWVF